MSNQIIKLLAEIFKVYDVPITRHAINQAIYTHPEYPSMQCISDALDSWKVKHVVMKLTLKKLRVLDVPAIAYMKKGEYVWITQVTDSKVYFGHDSAKRKSESHDRFEKKWSGVVLIIENVDDAGELDYKKRKSKELKEKVIKHAAIIGCVALLCALTYFSWVNDDNLSLPLKLILLFFNIIGCHIAYTLIRQENHQFNHLAQKFCKRGTRIDCYQVTESRYSKLFGVLSWAQLGIAYFFTIILWVCIAPLTANWLSPLWWILILSLPFTVWSLFTQAILIRKWCLFCCAIVFLLWINATILYFFIPFNNAFPIAELLLIALLFLVCITATMYIGKMAKFSDPYLESREMARIKYNAQTLQSQLSEINQKVNNTGFIWRKSQASYEIALFVSARCLYCGNAIKELHHLMGIYPNFTYRLIFAIHSDNMDNESTIITSYLVTLNKTMNKNDFFNTLDTWYSMQEKTLDSLQKTFSAPFTADDNKEEIGDLYQFSQQNKINYTPAILLNGQLLSQLYSYNDLYAIIRTLNAEGEE